MLLLLKFLPKNILSRWTGWLVTRPLPGKLRLKALRAFARRYKINMEEAEFPLEHYPHIGGLFTRRLKAGVRPLRGSRIHPVDGVLSAQGKIEEGMALQAKGKKYSIAELIEDAEKARFLEGGTYHTYYLCPTDYHRVHSPLNGQILESVHIAGTLWPVNPQSVLKVQDLFVINERLVVEILPEGEKESSASVFAVLVGATNVGKMTASFDKDIVTNRLPTKPRKTYTPPKPIRVGEELGIFHMGSTVIMLYPPGSLKKLPPMGAVRMGQSLEGKES